VSSAFKRYFHAVRDTGSGISAADQTRTYLYGPAVRCKPDVSDGGTVPSFTTTMRFLPPTT
jgi:hypothetical protein